MTEIKLTISDITAKQIKSAYDYVYSHHELSSQNEDDREAVTMLMLTADNILLEIERKKNDIMY